MDAHIIVQLETTIFKSGISVWFTIPQRG